MLAAAEISFSFSEIPLGKIEPFLNYVNDFGVFGVEQWGARTLDFKNDSKAARRSFKEREADS